MHDSLLSSAIKVALVIILLGIILNDVGQVALNYYNTGENANQIANTALQTFQTYKSESVVRSEALKTASSKGIVLEYLKIDSREAVVQVKSDTPNTLWVNRIKPLVPYLSIHVRTTATAL